ncbi:uncharacterized protein LOC141661315 [Apium graveolens]|uniref:uncharacterized protein LOC141661315 n=1 Tax=Apium graveolens TaxID=4045 RepID=UPI003D79D2D9
METISVASRIEELRIKLGFSNCFSVDRIGRSGGLTVFWKMSAKCSIVGYSQNHVDLVFTENNIQKWRLSCFYGFLERARRSQSWELICNLAQLSTLPWCMVGDFNDLLYATDKKGIHPHPEYLMRGFQNAIDSSSLAELDLNGGSYTWEKGRGTREWVQERLDRAFANMAVSDHDAIFLELLSVEVPKRVFRFKFENTWLKESTFVEEVKQCWENLPASHLVIKLMSVSGYMEKWGRDFFNKFKQKVRNQKALMDSLQDKLDECSVKEFVEARDRLNEILLHEEVYWKQRAKLFWLQEGDGNTNLFHSTATTRKKKSRINFLVTEEGTRVDDAERMVLANRLKKILPQIISEEQSTFVRDRCISDNVIVAFEIIHHMRGEKRGEEGNVALKLDISKAYDRVNWDYLRKRMQDMGFLSYDVCFNGETVGPICPKRGLRQGDPLSPYLFLFYAEGLSNLLDNTAAEGRIQGCKISIGAPEVTHLFFIDDSFLFFKASKEEAHQIKLILNAYENSSGQAVNYSKSGIFFSSNVRRDKQREISGILGVHGDITKSNYLGLPSLVVRSKKRVFGFIKEKVCKRIDSWRSKPISRAGKSILIRNVAQAIPSYSMTCFLLPKSLIDEIEKMFNAFWWKSGSTRGRGIRWHSWDAMAMPKCKGGMGFRNLYGFNIALYFPHESILAAKRGSKTSCIWTGIWQAKEHLSQGFRWVLGDGNDIVATKDAWLARKINFKVHNLPLYEGRNEKAMISFSRDDALAILAMIVPQRQVEDRIVWSKSIDGHYNVKIGYRLWHDLYAVRSNLRSKGVNTPIICPMCSADVEHLLHLFFECPYANSCWQTVGLSYDMREITSAPEWLLRKLETAKYNEVVKVCITLGGIWYWRNCKVWKDKYLNPSIVMANCFKVFKEWKDARANVVNRAGNTRANGNASKKWEPPLPGELKVNVDASFIAGSESFTVGMVARDCKGLFIEGNSITLTCPTTVVEAECIGVREALSWVMTFQNKKIKVESDSLLTIRAIQGKRCNLMEIGHVIESCRSMLQHLPLVSINYVRKQANRVAHSLARITCSVNCFTVFSSPPNHLVETILNDFSME